MPFFEHAVFGNRDGGHQLLETSLVGEESLLEQLRFLVDRPAGYVGPEVAWSPYWGCGPLRDWWVLWRGDEDKSAPRNNMVRSRVVMVHHQDVGSVQDLGDLFQHLSANPTANKPLPVGTMVDALARGVRPLVVPDLVSAPALVAALWPRLWPAARRCFALRTLFGSESLESGAIPHVVIVPKELRPRWQSHYVLDGNRQQPDTEAAAWFSGTNAPTLGRLLRANWERLPGDFGVLVQLERVTRSIKALQEGRGQFADALLIARTVEAETGGFDLPEEDLNLLVGHLSYMRDAKATDIRAASLVELRVVGQSLAEVEMAVSMWIQEKLPGESDVDTLCILEYQVGDSRVDWWLRAVRTGLAKAFANMSSDWAKAIWRWWTLNPEAVAWTEGLLHIDSVVEISLLSHVPAEISDDLQGRMRTLCAKHGWAKLLAGILRTSEPLTEAVKVLCETVAHPENGLDVLLQQRRPSEIVVAAAECGWNPLTERAVKWTKHDRGLLDSVHIHAPGFLPLIDAHLSAGGELPSTVRSHAFILRLFDGCIDGDEQCVNIVLHLGPVAAEVALMYHRQDGLWSTLGPERRTPLLSATGAAWLKAFVAGKKPERPGSVLAEVVERGARSALRGGSIGRVIDFLTTFPEVSERGVVDWLQSEGFSRCRHDDERLGELLVARDWSFAVKCFARSRKGELKAAARHARRLSALNAPNWKEARGDKMRILFLAANPTSQTPLSIAEEARRIEEKVRASKFRDEIVFRQKWAVRPDDLHQAFLEEEPTVVHFSGHGAGQDGIVLHSEREDDERLVSSEALAHLFKVLRNNIRMVVLNACYSEEQAARIVEEIDFVVGMADSIGDDAARVFAAALYRGLGFGQTVQTAFDLGVNELELMGLKDDVNVPVLLTREGVDPTSVTLVRPATA